jgi:uncharacterized protein YdaU (DUF1376 family)
MSDRPWYPHYSVDFVHGVVGLGAAEIGTYIVILDLIYDRGQPIVNDPKSIGAILGEGPRMARALIGRLIKAGKLVEVDGCLENFRARKELENIAKTSRKHRENSANAARIRWSKQQNQALSNATHARARAQSQSQSYKKESSPNGEPKKAASPRGSRLPPEWQLSLDDEAWALEQGMSRERIARAALKFKNYWLSRSRDAARLDWSLTWQNWVIKDLEDIERSKGNGHARQPKRTTADIAREFSDYARDRSEDHRPPVRVLPRSRP